jgi:predicted nucleotidyltransferase
MPSLPFDVDRLISLCQAHHVCKIGLFGSMARGEATDNSDIDLVVTFDRPTSLLACIALEQALATALDRPIDLLTEGAISPYLRDNILSELKIIYDASPHDQKANFVNHS